VHKNSHFGKHEICVIALIVILAVLSWSGNLRPLISTILLPVIGFTYFYLKKTDN